MPRRILFFFFPKSFKLKTLHKDFGFKCVLYIGRKVFALATFGSVLRIRVGWGEGLGEGGAKQNCIRKLGKLRNQIDWFCFLAMDSGRT